MLLATLRDSITATENFLEIRLRPALSRAAKQVSSASEQGTEPPRSLKATVAVAALANPKSRSGSVVWN